MKLAPAAPLAITMLLTLGAVLTGCQGSPAGPPIDNSSLPASASAAGTAESLAPSFSVSTGTGSVFSLDDKSGEVVVLYFSFPG